MSLDRDFVLNALLRHNYLPTQRKSREELPPVFTTKSFTPEVAKVLASMPTPSRKGGFDAVEFRMTRFNGVPRILSLPHPVAHAHLSLCIHEHWNEIDNIANDNPNSVIRPRQHDDGRIIIMDYEKSFEKTQRNLRLEFGKRFRAHTDISNCYPSIYSHAVSWATVGFDHAKAHSHPSFKSMWFNQLDEKIRWNKRNETQGIPIGPATSNIISECILAKVDAILRNEFDYVRFVDDYTAYCETEEQAREFIRRLGEELAKYKLLLNIRKTEIVPLPTPVSQDWIGKLAMNLPDSENISAHDAVHFLDLATTVSKAHPDGSVLKYAIKSLLGRGLETMAEWDVLPYVLMLSFHHTVLLPLLERLFDNTLLPDFLGDFRYGDELGMLLDENIRYHRSDGMCWVLYYMNKYKVSITSEQAANIVETRDCFALLFLYLSGEVEHQKKVTDFANSLNTNDLYELDQYWLLLYQLYLDGKISNLYSDESTFEILKDHEVPFLEHSDE